MKHLLNGKLKVWHVLVVGFALLLFSGGAVALADTSAITGFWTPGQILLASSYRTTSVDITGSNNPSVKVLNVSINVPANKKADLQVSFSADYRHLGASGLATYSYCSGYFGLDTADPDSAFKPGGFAAPGNYAYQLLGGDTAHEPAGLTVTMVGFRKNVPAGSHTVNVYINSAYNGCEIQNSNLNVVASIH